MRGVVCVALLALIAQTYAAIITEVTPRYGSIAGGTLITIRGEGFARGGLQGRTDVMIGNYPCDVVEYWSSDTQLVCYTPKMSGSSYSRLSVFLLAIADGSSGSAECRTDCTFYYRWDRTPYLSELSPAASSEGALYFSGYHLSTTPGDYEVKINDLWCDASEETFPNNPAVNQWGQGSVAAQAPPITAGIYNVSIAVQNAAGAGLAQLARSGVRATFSNQTYNIEIFPRINSVSSNLGSLLGGDSLTITGTGFDESSISNNQVKVGGVDCDIVSATATQIVCEPQASSASSSSSSSSGGSSSSSSDSTSSDSTATTTTPLATIFPGARGALRKIWTSTWIDFASRVKNFPTRPADVVTALVNGLVTGSFGDAYLQEITGFFVPPRTGKFSFYILSDDWSELSVGTTGTNSQLTVQCTCPGYTSSFYQYPEQISTPVQLTAGVAYPFRLIHQEGSGGDYVRVALREHDVPGMSDNQIRYMSVLPQQTLALETKVRREQQELWIEGANNGTFRISVAGSVMTDTIGWNEAVSTDLSSFRSKLADALTRGKACSSISIAGPVATGGITNIPAVQNLANQGAARLTWTVTFTCPTAAPHADLGVVNIALRAPPTSSARPTFGASRTVTASKPLSGTFRIQWNSLSTGELPYNSDGTTVEGALEALDGIHDVSVSQSGNGMDSRSFSIIFLDPPGAQPALTIVPVSLEGEEVTYKTSVIEGGKIDDMIIDPFPSSYLRMPNALPPVEVYTNGHLASCHKVYDSVADSSVNTTDCIYQFSNAVTASVSAIELPSGAASAGVAEGDVIRVRGTGFDTTTPSNNFIRLGGGIGSQTGCVGNAALTSNEFTCVVTGAIAGSFAPEVIVFGRGKAQVASGISNIAVRRTFRTVTPSRGSLGGGSTLTIAGTGFPLAAASAPAGFAVQVGTSNCVLVSVANQQIVCTTASTTTAGRATISVAGSAASSLAFEYSMAATPTISAVTPVSVSSGSSTKVTITGSFPAEAPLYTVQIAGRECLVREQTTTSIMCLFRRGPVPDQTKKYTPQIMGAGIGLAMLASGATADATSIDVALRVTDISPRTGSFAGGAVVTITGAGFDPTYYSMSTYLYMFYRAADREEEQRTRCEPLTVEYTKIVCKTYGHPPPLPTSGDITTRFDVRVNNVSAVCSDCSYTFGSTATPRVDSITPAQAVGGSSVTLSGSNLAGASPAVRIGGKECTVTASTASSITCTLPFLPAGQANILVAYPSVGNAYVKDGLFFEFGISFTGLVPHVGSAQGGTTVTIFGKGLSTNATIRFGSSNAISAARIISVADDSVVVLTPADYNVKTAAEARIVSISQNKVRLLGQRDLRYQDVLPGFEDSFESSTPDYSAVTASCTITSTDLSSSDVCSFAVDGTNAAIALITDVSVGGVSSGAASGSASTITAPTARRGDVVTITGSGFVNARNNSYVNIGGLGCEILTWTDASITCRFGAVPAGEYPVLVFVDGKGLARSSGSGRSIPNRPFTVISSFALSTTSGSSLEGSFGGGRTISFSGEGFGDATTTAVTVCGTPCKVTAASYDSVSCTVQPLITEYSARQFNLAQDAPFTAASYFGSGSGNYAAAFDGTVETNLYTTAGTGCSAGFVLAKGYSGAVSKIRFYPIFRKMNLVNGARFQASADGTTYFDLYVVPATPLSSWSEVTPDFSTVPASARSSLRYFRYVGPDASNCQIAEVQFVGLMTADGISATSTDVSCQVSVSVTDTSSRFPLPAVTAAPSQSKASTTPFTYRSAATPYVTSINPTSASALGGTVVTVSGSNLASASSVLLRGYECTISTRTDTAVVCTTTRRTTVVTSPAVALTTTNGGAAGVSSGALFRYLDRWSALTTWRFNEPPVAGDTVIIPEGQAVILDESPPILFVLVVQGELVFDNSVDGLHLQATYILVQGGKLEVGTEDNPFLKRATITLHGDKFKTIELPDVGSKVLAVMNRNPGIAAPDAFNILQMQYFNPSTSRGGMNPDTLRKGVLDLHGKPRKRVWTFVDKTASAGSTTIVTSEDVDYAPGELLVLSSGDSDYHHAEEVTVASLGSDRRTITITEPLKYDHHSEVYQIEGRRVDARCQIGLLSRNIVVQGVEGSEAQKFGCHTMNMGKATFRLENIEIRRCGQAGNKGRYSSHTHMSGPQPDSYVRSNSIHHSFQRATTIHGTKYLRVQRNFAYHVMAHTFFVEDGGEEENVIEENLVITTLKSFVMLRSDTKPASFWTATPRNFWRHNVAAGCTNDGYWLELPNKPGGPSSNMPFCCNAEHLGEHYNNTAHSNGVHGLRIYPIYLPLATPCDPNSGPAPQYFYRFNSHHNGQHGIFGKRNGDLHHIDATLHVNDGDELFWQMYLSVVYTNDPNLKNVLSVGSYDPSKPKTAAGGVWAPQDEYWYADGVTFVNYATGALRGCAKCDDQTALKQGGYTYRLRNLKFVNSPKRVEFTRPFKQIFLDLDGTLTGKTNAYLTPARKWLEDPQCEVQDDTVYNKGTICSGVAVRRLQIDEVLPSELDFKPAMLSGQNSQPAGSFGTVDFLPKELYGWVVPVLANRDLSFNFYNPVTKRRHDIDWRSMRIRWSEPDYVVPGEWERITMEHTDWRWQYRVTTGNGDVRPWLTEGESPKPTNNFGTGAMGAAYFNGQKGTKTWSVVITTNNITASGYPYEDWGKGQVELVSDSLTMRVAALQCAPGMPDCNIESEVALGDKKMWSDPATWSTGDSDPGRVPEEGEDVVIPAGLYVVMDINPPRLADLRIWGKLEFLDTADRELRCDSIVVGGVLQIGEARVPFQHKAAITLLGDRLSKTVVVDDSLFLGNKMMVVLGRLEMHGKPIETTWTRLASTADRGSTILKFNDAVDWNLGDELVIGTTDYQRDHTEYVKVASISSDKRTITIDAPLTNRHFAGPVTMGSKTTTLAAGVGTLSRNIVFRGELANADDKYGAHLVVADLPLKAKKGSVAIRHVRFENTGKFMMEHASVLFKYQGTYTEPPRAVPTTGSTNGTATDKSMPNNLVEGCAFANSFNYGVVGEGAAALKLYRNVISRAYRSCIDLDDRSTVTEIVSNFISNVNQTPDETTDWVRPIAGIFLEASSKTLSGNLVAGSHDGGFTIRPVSCTGTDVLAGGDSNEAVGCRVGFWILPGGRLQSCSLLEGATAWKSYHMGLTTVDQDSDLTMRDVVLTDNYIGMSLSFFYTSPRAHIVMDGAIVSGNTDATECTETLECQAFGANDVSGKTCDSVLGTTYGRVGLLMPQFGNRGKTCERDPELPVCRPPNTPERLCGLGFDARYGLPPTVHALFEMNDIVFANFQPTMCNKKAVAVKFNPDQPDYTPVTRMSRVQWDKVDVNAQFDLSKNHRECTTGCDAHMNFFIEDVDGTVTGANSRTFIVPNQQLSEASAACTEKAEWYSSLCNLDYVQGTLENIDDDRGSRRMGPVHVERMVKGETAVSAGYSIAVGPFDHVCPMRFHFGQFPIVFVPGRHHKIVPSGMMPGNSRLWFHTDDPTKSATVSIFYTKPFTLVVYADGDRNVNRSVARPVTLNDAAGTYVQDPQQRTLNITLRGGVREYTIRTLPLVQISLSLATTINEFYSDRFIEHMSQLLQIDPSTIKVVDVQPGSVVVSVEISDPRQSSPNDTEYHSIVSNLQTVAKNLVTKSQEGNLDLGYTVLTMQVDAPKNSLSETNEDLGIPTGAFVPANLDFSSKSMSAGAIAGIILAIVAVFAAFGGFVYYRRRHHASFAVESVQNEAIRRNYRSDSELEEGLAERELPHKRSGVNDGWGDEEGNVVGVTRAKGDNWLKKKAKEAAAPNQRKVGIAGDDDDENGGVEMQVTNIAMGGKSKKVVPSFEDDDEEATVAVVPPPPPMEDDEDHVETDPQASSSSVRTAVKSAARRLSKMDEQYDRLH